VQRTTKENNVKRYGIQLEGIYPLILHHDNIEWADHLKRWRGDPNNKKLSVAGDDRSPAFTWLGSLYHDDDKIVMPSDNLMRCFMEGGAAVPVPDGKNGKTFKAQTQSGMLTTEAAWPVLVDGKPVDSGPLFKLQSELNFETHKKSAVDRGFELYVKRARIGQQKHIRVRPRFHRWTLRGHIDVWDAQITTDALRSILSYAGEYKGLGDWRPSSKTPGPYGRFKATVEI
jgi:hypothetical protein